MIRARCRGRQGVTLLEMLAVVAMAALLVGLGLRLLFAANDLWTTHQERTAAMRSGWLWVHRFAAELRESVAAAESTEIQGVWSGTSAESTLYEILPEPRRTFGVPEKMQEKRLPVDSIRFPASPAFNQPGNFVPSQVRYRINRDEAGRDAGVERTTAPVSVTIDLGRKLLVNSDVVSLDFEYLDEAGNWLQEWDSQSAPRAVRIDAGVLLREGKTGFIVERFSTVVHLPSGSEISR